LSLFIRPIKHHSPHRAFHFFKSGNGTVEMTYKNSPLDSEWIGYHTTYGFQLMSGFPNRHSCPETQLPIEIPDEDLKDIPTMLDFMETEDKSWWINFIDNQSILTPSDEKITEITNLFWDFEFSPFQLPSELENNIEPPPSIQIEQHPIVPIQLAKGSLVAVLAPGDEWTFWLGEIYNISEANNEPLYHVHYHQEKNGVWSRMPKKASGSVGTATIGSILVANYQYTKEKKLKKFVKIQIQKKIDELKNLISDQSEDLSVE
jgi:hypothetical protein